MTVFYTISELTTIKRASYQNQLDYSDWGFAYMLQKLLNLPIASGVLGFFILLILLQMQWLNLEKVSLGADILLGELVAVFYSASGRCDSVSAITFDQWLENISGDFTQYRFGDGKLCVEVKIFLQQDDME